ncbi:cob(I)yrinic acid a,c-diamide adenosyltransferase [Kangiella marina]|uniref:Corrinoid adenosyltransferase n=1 Tax=Kangiella marina TaxID=1079178 RepID=A0ABP8ID43_9GAMM
MANRLTQITTGVGDSGTTRLADGKEVSKSSLRICAIGAVDELNAAIGMFVAAYQLIDEQKLYEYEDIAACCHQVQNELFNVGGELASPSNHFMSDSAISDIEHFIESINDSLPPLREFVIPGQNVASANAHFARCVARRAEREVIKLSEQETVSTDLLIYLNRLSDAFFIIARVTGRLDSKTEPQWHKSSV